MKKAHLFPGQGSQFEGMANDLLGQSPVVEEMFIQAQEVLGFDILSVMKDGSMEELTQTKVTQPAIFLYSAITYAIAEPEKPAMVAGHSLGEFTALYANGCLDFESGLRLVSKRALAMQKACEDNPSTMAAIIGLPDESVEQICESIEDEIVVPANYNSPGQIVISGTIKGIDEACQKMTEAGAKRAIKLNVGGAFHSPLMQSAQDELAQEIEKCAFAEPEVPIYQNVTARAVSNPEEIKFNLITQLTSPVKWTQSIKQMMKDGAEEFEEYGPGVVLTGLVRKIRSAR